MTTSRRAIYEWKSRSKKILKGVATSCKRTAEWTEQCTNTDALACVTFPTIASSVAAYPWGLLIVIGEETQKLKLTDVRPKQLTPVPIYTMHTLMYREPLKIEEISFGSNIGGWSRVRAPRILLAFLYGLLLDIAAGKLETVPGSQGTGN